MVSEEMKGLGNVRSVIREIFEYAKVRAGEIGAENIFDFSLGNPSVPAPAKVNEMIKHLVDTEDSTLLHGYTSAQGDLEVRTKIAANIQKRFGAQVGPNDLYMTCGAAASLSCAIKALACDGDEFVVFSPFFPEYSVFIQAAGGKIVIVPPTEPDFQIDMEVLKASVNAHTKAILFNSPNNPSGVVYSKETVNALCDFLRDREKEYGHPIYLIADEPYRELVYGDVDVPYIMNYYNNSLVCYSYSKSLSLPGERIGYVAVNPKCEERADVYAAICGAGRALGYVCAPSMMQKVVAECDGLTSDVSVYRKNRDLLYNGLTELGFTCVQPDGAFYLFVKTLEPDAAAFCERAKKYELLLVPSDSFGIGGYVRLAYCVKTEMIEKSLPAFKALAEEYQK
jgi:aspartate aminotransferase